MGGFSESQMDYQLIRMNRRSREVEEEEGRRRRGEIKGGREEEKKVQRRRWIFWMSSPELCVSLSEPDRIQQQQHHP